MPVRVPVLQTPQGKKKGKKDKKKGKKKKDPTVRPTRRGCADPQTQPRRASHHCRAPRKPSIA